MLVWYRISCSWFCMLLLAFACQAQDAPKLPAKDAGSEIAKTQHRITIDGKPIDYNATAGFLPLKDEQGKLQAKMFYVAYTQSGVDSKTRPLTFCFNGGPGSSSVWLHLGTLGPKRVVLTDDGEAPAPPARLVENEASILDLTDLVFIDPVSTGYSRAADEKNARDFHGLQEDVSAVAEFIRLYVTQNQRWESPKFLAGESYGTTRAASLAGYLQSRLGMRMNGVLLISAVLQFGTVRFDEGNDLPYILFLPTYAATAWYHKKLGADAPASLPTYLKEVEAFASGEYATALHKGLSLSDSDRKAMAAKVAKYIGVSSEFVERNDLRIEGQRFMREVLRERGLTVGRFDSRLLGKDNNDAAERPEYDPSYAAVQGPYTETFNSYVREQLKFESDLPYEILTSRVQPWNYGQSGNNRYVNVAPTLRAAMAQNSSLRVFVANGYYDLATPYAATQYTIDHLSSDRALRDRVTMTYYEAGHMMYIHTPSRAKLRTDLADFYKSVLPHK